MFPPPLDPAELLGQSKPAAKKKVKKKEKVQAAPKPVKKASKSQIGRRSQRKGKEFQKEVAAELADKLDLPEEDVYSAMAGLTGSDIALSRAARLKWPWATECKNTKQVNMSSWLAQAEADAHGAGLPFLLIFKLHGRRRKYVTLDFEQFMRLVTAEVEQ